MRILFDLYILYTYIIIRYLIIKNEHLINLLTHVQNEITYDNLANLHTLEMCINETMRYYPSAL